MKNCIGWNTKSSLKSISWSGGCHFCECHQGLDCRILERAEEYNFFSQNACIHTAVGSSFPPLPSPTLSYQVQRAAHEEEQNATHLLFQILQDVCVGRMYRQICSSSCWTRQWNYPWWIWCTRRGKVYVGLICVSSGLNEKQRDTLPPLEISKHSPKTEWHGFPDVCDKATVQETTRWYWEPWTLIFLRKWKKRDFDAMLAVAVVFRFAQF